jgi:hypothetical protein
MFDVTAGPARALVSAREQVDQEQMRRLMTSGALVLDDRRRRPLYFDGRFLAARDLTREQNYFLTREADLARATGGGVVHGMSVSQGENGTLLVIDAGHGVTAAGELVLVPQPLILPITGVAEIQRLDASFGLMRIPSESPLNRTGLFIVALRPVEFSANPIAAYPTSLSGTRTVEDGDIIEGAAATLIPFPDGGGDSELAVRRARAARTIFVEGATRGFPVDALPLALVALERGIVRWIDPYLVRRELGVDHGDMLGLGVVPRAVREAYIIQYDNHLADVVQERQSASRGLQFAASEHFLALPPAGRMPAAAINTQDFTQAYFPPHMSVELSIMPQEEIAALLEESLLLPPIDLTSNADALDSTAVLVLVPVPLRELRALKTTLATLARPLFTTAPGLVAQRLPIEVLRGIRLPRLPSLLPPVQDPITAAWARAVARAASSGSGMLWYVRRRNVSYRADVVGSSVPIASDDLGAERAMTTHLEMLGLQPRYTALTAGASTLTDAEAVTLLASDKLTRSDTLTRAAFRELEAAKEALPGGAGLNRVAVLAIEERFADPQLGEGLARLERANADLTKAPAQIGLANSLKVPEVDRVGRLLADDKLGDFAKQLGDAAKAGDVEKIKTLLANAGVELHA